MRTVLVTGAEGFAGSHLLEHLRSRGYQVVAGVRNRARKLAYERQKVPALVCDVTDAVNVARVVASVRPDGIVHLAALTHPAEAAVEPLAAYQSIVSAWANVLDAVRRAVPRARVVLASACEVYGNAGRDLQPLSESTPPRPINTFGSLKRAAEAIAHTFYRDYHLDVTIARPFHYTGPNQPTRFFYGVAAQQLVERQAGGNRELWLPDLSCYREVLHVRDVAAAYERLLVDGKPDQVYNICSGQALSCREIIAAMAAELGLTVELRELPADQEQQIRALRGDNSKICQELGWKPTRSVADTLRELVFSYRQAGVPVTQ